VGNLNVTTSVNGDPYLVRISWDHIPDSAWNGGIGEYLVNPYSLAHSYPVLVHVYVQYLYLCNISPP